MDTPMWYVHNDSTKKHILSRRVDLSRIMLMGEICSFFSARCNVCYAMKKKHWRSLRGCLGHYVWCAETYATPGKHVALCEAETQLLPLLFIVEGNVYSIALKVTHMCRADYWKGNPTKCKIMLVFTFRLKVYSRLYCKLCENCW